MAQGVPGLKQDYAFFTEAELCITSQIAPLTQKPDQTDVL